MHRLRLVISVVVRRVADSTTALRLWTHSWHGASLPRISQVLSFGRARSELRAAHSAQPAEAPSARKKDVALMHKSALEFAKVSLKAPPQFPANRFPNRIRSREADVMIVIQHEACM